MKDGDDSRAFQEMDRKQTISKKTASEYRSQFKVRCRSCLEIQDTASLVVISQFYLHLFASYRLLNGRKLDSF